ncbi:gliding motility-associated C-terminal domain-containing protein, partial [Flavobacterium algicola]|uniref:gliding motility-associated C-terminal domain-containing protein n=1 Tax=Flavobacterium algicola TaxID=556529 RepID=UPI001EFE5382
NCSIATMTLDKTTFDCSNVGINTVILTVTDTGGNSDSATATVTIIDDLKPIVLTQNITVPLDASGNATITAAAINNGSTDNCSIATMTLDKTTFDCSNVGVNTVILTVTDASGNSASANAIVTIPRGTPPTIANTLQEFCKIDNPLISDIEVNGQSVQWYETSISTTALSSTMELKTANYFAVITQNNCSSDRIAVTITVNDAVTPTGASIQYACTENKGRVVDLKTDQKEVIWYETPTGGNPLDFSTPLENNKKYYAAYLGAYCESAARLEVLVIQSYCDVRIHNGISANGDGKNDFLAIEGVNEFLDNSIEIFSSSGVLIYKVNHYGSNGNVFRGYPNVGTNSNGSLLPFGTYYYAFTFINQKGESKVKTGFLHFTN